MKRRQFIQKSVLTAVAMTIPFSKMVAQKLGDFDTFTGTKTNEKTKEELLFEMTIYNDLNTKFADLAIEKKIIKFIAYKRIDGKFKAVKSDLKVGSIKMLDNKDGKTIDVYKIETTLLQTNSSEFDLPKELNLKKLTFLYHPESGFGGTKDDTLTLLDKKNNNYLVLSFKEKSTDDGCFLTTACMNILGKADDCYELYTLRKFRDCVLKSNEAGETLIKKYYQIAPQIVKAIDRRTDKNEIYNDIYTQMILPTLLHIEKNDSIGAITIYQDYTLKLEKCYLGSAYSF